MVSEIKISTQKELAFGTTLLGNEEAGSNTGTVQLHLRHGFDATGSAEAGMVLQSYLNQ